MEHKNTFLNISLIIATLIFLGLIAVRLIGEYKITYIFPLDTSNDISSYLGILHFFNKYGFLNTAPEWYGGIEVLKLYSPGWFFFTLPLLKFFGDVKIAAYASLIILYLIGLIVVMIFANSQRFTKLEGIFLYSLLFGNSLAIGDFIRNGRLPALFGWIAMVGIMAIILKYKDKHIDIAFYLLFIPTCFIALIAHAQETLLAGFSIIPLILIKPWRERIHIFLSGMAATIFALFWLIPFLKGLRNSTIDNFAFTNAILDFKGVWAFKNIGLFVMIFGFIIMVLLHLREAKWKSKEIWFYSPFILLAIIIATKAIVYVPFMNIIYLNTYSLLFLLLASYLFLKDKPLKNIAAIIIVLMAIANVLITHYHTPYFAEHSAIAEDTLNAMEHVNGTYLIISSNDPSAYTRAFYSYGAIYLNLTTASGWSTHEVSKKWWADLTKISDGIKKEDCKLFLEGATKTGTTEFIAYKDNCQRLKECELSEKYFNQNACLYVL